MDKFTARSQPHPQIEQICRRNTASLHQREFVALATGLLEQKSSGSILDDLFGSCCWNSDYASTIEAE